MIGQTSPNAPTTTNATPMTTFPITIESRREVVSATIPVGTSKRNTESLHDGPDEHELEGAHADLRNEVVGRHGERQGPEKRRAAAPYAYQTLEALRRCMRAGSSRADGQRRH